MVVPARRVHTRLVHLCSHAHVSTHSHHMSAPTSARLCTDSHACGQSKDRPTNPQSMPGAGLPAGVPAGRLSWARLQLRDRRALMTGVCLSRRRLPALQFAGPGLTAHSLPGPLCIVSVVWFPGGMSVSQCSKEDGRSSSGPPHETAAPKRTYDMMEGRVSRAISSASIEGVCPARLPTLGVERGP